MKINNTDMEEIKLIYKALHLAEHYYLEKWVKNNDKDYLDQADKFEILINKYRLKLIELENVKFKKT